MTDITAQDVYARLYDLYVHDWPGGFRARGGAWGFY